MSEPRSNPKAEIRWSPGVLAYTLTELDAPAGDDDPHLVDYCSVDIRDMSQRASRIGRDVIKVVAKPRGDIVAGIRPYLQKACERAELDGDAGREALADLMAEILAGLRRARRSP